MTHPPGEPDRQDVTFMRRAMRLAMNGRGRVEPNPMVGCVIVKDGRVIGEGYHQQFGGPHAEPNGLASCTEWPAGVTGEGPVLEGEAKQLIAPFIARTRLGRPYVTLKWAQTADGKVAGRG